MTARDPVPVVRRFSPIRPSSSDSDERQIQAILGFGNLATWEQIDKGYRSVIIAEAGAGKTFEMKARATHVEQMGARTLSKKTGPTVPEDLTTYSS